MAVPARSRRQKHQAKRHVEGVAVQGRAEGRGRPGQGRQVDSSDRVRQARHGRRTRPPTMISGMAKRVPVPTRHAPSSRSPRPPPPAPARQPPRLAAWPRAGRIASSSSAASSATADRSQAIHRKGSRRRARQPRQRPGSPRTEPRSPRRGSSPLPAAARRAPRAGTRRPRTSRRSRPGPRPYGAGGCVRDHFAEPQGAARLKTFDPITTRRPAAADDQQSRSLPR